MKRFCLVVPGLLWLLSWNLTPSIFASPSLAIAADKVELPDLNTVTVDQLKTLQGIGEAYSAKIIKGRSYKRNDELAQKQVIPQATYDKIRDHIVAKQK